MQQPEFSFPFSLLELVGFCDQLDVDDQLDGLLMDF